MAIKLTWLAHSGFILEINGKTVLIDPFLSGNPLAPMKVEELQADFILVSHGHGDHSSDVAAIAKRTDARVIANVEVAGWIAKQGAKNTIGINTGGGRDFGFGRVELTQAFHSSSMPDGSYGGQPNGFIIFAPGVTFYHSGDTALFSDMQLFGDKGIDVAMLCVGDFYTMGLDDSLKAIRYIRPKSVLPMHYNTFPPIEQDIALWAQRVHTETQAKAIVLDPGGSHEF